MEEGEWGSMVLGLSGMTYIHILGFCTSPHQEVQGVKKTEVSIWFSKPEW